MRLDNPRRSERFLLLPVQRVGNAFKVLEETDFSDLTHFCDSGFLNLLNRNHSRTKAKVEIQGKLVSAFVFVANDPSDCSFVPVDLQLNPIDYEPPEQLDAHLFANYLVAVGEYFSHAESLVPEQSTYLLSQYIKPFLRRVYPHEGLGEVVSMSELIDLRQVVVLGGPGAGKTSLLRKLAVDLASLAMSEEEETPELLPVYFQLRSWRPGSDMLSWLRNSLMRSFGDWIADNFAELAEQGKLLVMLDGADEAPLQYRKQMFQRIREFSELYASSRIVVSTRPSSYQWELSNFEHVEICPFNFDQVREFSFRRLYRKRPWRNFISCLREAEEMQQLLSNPLLLGIAVFLYLRNNVVPLNSAQLVKDFVTALTETWDTVRGINRDLDLVFTPTRARNYLGRIAYQCKERKSMAFSSQEALEWIDPAKTGEEMHHILISISEASGIIIREEKESWRFQHSTFQEFFAASYLVERSEGLSEVFQRHNNDDDWRVLWFQTSGLSSDPEYMLNLFREDESSSDTEKAKKALKVLFQSLVMESSSLMSVEAQLRQVLLRMLSDFQTCKMSPEEPEKHEGLPVRADPERTLCIEHKEGSISPEEAKAIVTLVSDLYNTRWTTYSEFSHRVLGEAESDVLMQLLELFTHGDFLEHSHSEDRIDFYVKPESPEIPYD